jgi:hypothetical protein
MFDPISNKCPAMVQNSVKSVLQNERQGFEDKYLGLPNPDDIMNKGKF